MLKEARIVSVLPLFPLPQYVVVLEDADKTKLVPIWIGVNEGNAIALEMQGEKFPRPLTHDLMVLMLEALGAQIEKVVVNDLKDSSYYALIHIKQGGKTILMDARPSDSLALAVRVHCPIFIDEKVLEKCPEIQGPITQQEVEKFKSALKTMSPEEFFKKLESFKEPPSEEEGEEEDGEEGEGGEDKPGGKW